MNALIEKIFHIIFPPSKEERLLLQVHTEQFLALMQPGIHKEAEYLCPYTNTIVRAAIHGAKFHKSTVAIMLLGEILKKYLSNLYADNTHTILIIPIPLHKTRMRQRGYNQVEKIILEVSDINTQHALHTDILSRTINTAPQTTLNKDERGRNMQHAFSVKNPEKVRGAHILLVDDVITTGVTLRAAKAALLPHAPASVQCLALAH